MWLNIGRGQLMPNALENPMKKIQGLLLFSLVVTLVACGGADRPPNSNSIATKPIFLKNLTTGIKYDRSNLPKVMVGSFDGEDPIFSFSFFGLDRQLTIKKTSTNIIYSYKLIIDNTYYSLRSAIEEKLTEIEGKKIEFDCRNDSYNTKIGIYYSVTCKILSGSQSLVILERYPREAKDSPLHITTLTLTDESISKQVLDKQSEANKKQYKLQSAKAIKDI